MKVQHPRVAEITKHLTTARETYEHAKAIAQKGLCPMVGDATGDEDVLKQCQAVADEFGFELIIAEPLPEPKPAPELRTDGPTLEEFIEQGGKPGNYPPDGYAAVTLQDRERAAAAETLREDGPTLEEWIAAGYHAENYPPKGYAPKASLPTEPATPEPLPSPGPVDGAKEI